MSRPSDESIEKNKPFADELNRLIKEANSTAYYLAKDCGILYPRLHEYTKQLRIPKKETLAKIVNCFESKNLDCTELKKTHGAIMDYRVSKMGHKSKVFTDEEKAAREKVIREKCRERRRRFARYYVAYLDPKIALEKAGYKTKNHSSQSGKLLRNEEVKTMIAEEQESLAERIGVTQEKIALERKKLAFEDNYGKQSDAVITGNEKLKAIEDLEKQLGFAVAEKVDHTIEIKMSEEMEKYSV